MDIVCGIADRHLLPMNKDPMQKSVASCGPTKNTIFEVVYKDKAPHYCTACKKVIVGHVLVLFLDMLYFITASIKCLSMFIILCR